MNKPLLLVSLLCVSALCLPTHAQQDSFYGHHRVWNNMQNVGGSCVSSDYLVPTGSDGTISRSSAPFGTYRSRNASTAAPTDPRIVQQQRRLQALQQQRAQQQAMFQQQMQMRQRQMYQQPQQGSYYQSGQNTGAAPSYTYSGGTASYAPVQIYGNNNARPAQQRPSTSGK
jgi:hypothetical protein